MPRTDAGLRLLRRLVEYDGGHERTERANIDAIEAEAHAQGRAEALAEATKRLGRHHRDQHVTRQTCDSCAAIDNLETK